jgi:hypothetical protein
MVSSRRSVVSHPSSLCLPSWHPELLPKAVHGTTYKGLAHLTDILPTLIAGVLDRADLLGYGEDDDDVAADDVPKIAGGDDADDADHEAVIDHDPSQQSQQQQHQTGAGRRRRASSATDSAATLDGVNLWAALRGESPEYPRQEVGQHQQHIGRVLLFFGGFPTPRGQRVQSPDAILISGYMEPHPHQTSTACFCTAPPEGWNGLNRPVSPCATAS